MPKHLLHALATAIIAGLAGLAIHSVLMLAKDDFGFQPYEDFQRLRDGWTGERRGNLVAYLTGAMLWSFLCGRPHARLPGRRVSAKELSFALLSLGIMPTGFFLLAGQGLFGLQFGYGLWPAAFMFPTLAALSMVLSFTHTQLRSGDIWRGNRGPTLNEANNDKVKE